MSFKQGLEIAKDVTQIVAIIAAGLWGYARFSVAEAPSLEPRVAAGGELSWLAVGENECLAAFPITFENTGVTSVDVTEVHLRGWHIPTPPLNGMDQFFDTEAAAASNTPFFETRSTTGPFIQRYAPGTLFTHTYQWRMSRRPGIALFRAEFHASNAQDSVVWPAYSWSYVCGGTDTPSAPGS